MDKGVHLNCKQRTNADLTTNITSLAIDKSACVMRSYSPCPEKVTSVIISALLREKTQSYAFLKCQILFQCFQLLHPLQIQNILTNFDHLVLSILFILSVSDPLLCHVDSPSSSYFSFVILIFFLPDSII